VPVLRATFCDVLAASLARWHGSEVKHRSIYSTRGNKDNAGKPVASTTPDDIVICDFRVARPAATMAPEDT